MQSISTVAIDVPVINPDDILSVDEWLRCVLWNGKLPNVDNRSIPFEVHRLKARFPMSNGSLKIAQGVREIFEIRDIRQDDATPTAAGRKGKIVVIGRQIAGLDFKTSFLSMFKNA